MVACAELRPIFYWEARNGFQYLVWTQSAGRQGLLGRPHDEEIDERAIR